MKKILIHILLMVVVISLTGCVSSTIAHNNKSDYTEDILTYLEDKYDEDFIIKDLVFNKNIGAEANVYAKAYSTKYADEYFEVVYHLHSDENRFEDTYSNIIMQNNFDKESNISNIVFAKSLIETTNNYPNIDCSGLSIDEYAESLDYPVYLCNMVFVDNSKADNKDAVVQSIIDELIVSEVTRQFIYIHFTDKDKNFLEVEFNEHYDGVVMYFKDAEYVTDYVDIFIKDGKIQ